MLFPCEREQVETVQGERQRESGVYIPVHEYFELAFNAEMASPAHAHMEKVVGRVGFEARNHCMHYQGYAYFSMIYKAPIRPDTPRIAP